MSTYNVFSFAAFLRGILAGLVLLSAAPLSAAVIADYTFATDAADSSDANVTANAFVVGIGLSGYAGRSSSSETMYARSTGTDGSALSIDNAIISDDYLSVTITPETGYEINLASLTFDYGYTSQSIPSEQLAVYVLTSIDGFVDDGDVVASQIITADQNTSGAVRPELFTNVAINLSALQFQNISTDTEFRFYLSDTDNNNDLIHRIDNFVLNGVVSTVPNAPYFTTNPMVGGSATATVAYAENIAGYATDPDGDPLTFSKIDGPAWLHVSTNGALSGTPQLADIGANSFTVQVTDFDEGSDTATLSILVNDENGNPPPDPSATERIRLVWVDDPSTTATIAWDQISGSDAVVKYSTVDYGRAEGSYTNSKAVDRSITYRGMDNRFARLDGLLPDTNYHFVLVDSEGVSPRYWFRTAPDTPEPFTFIAGGDSRNNRSPRQKANRLVAKLRPLFVAFTGDMINSDSDTEWIAWLDDWQETVSSDGRIYPLLPHRGNHEAGGNTTVYNLFDTTPDNYYALTVGGNLLRYYVLNSESGESTQADWLENDLNSNGGMNAFTHLMAGYHKPMRPHTSAKPEGSSEYNAWAELFYINRFDLVFESDSHMMKRTAAIRPATGQGAEEGFIADAANGTVYVGEGCWGAPLRSADDGKEWTLDMDSFNGFDLVHVYPEQVEVFSVRVDLEDDVGTLEEGDSFSLPHGIDLWLASGGTRLVVNRGAVDKVSYAQFQLDMFADTKPPVGSKAHEDYDGDGVSNLAEFAFYMDPTTNAPPASGILPGIALGPLPEKYISHRRRTNTTVRFRYYITQDLTTGWTLMEEGTDYTLSAVPGSGYEDVHMKVTGAAGDYDQALYRIEIE